MTSAASAEISGLHPPHRPRVESTRERIAKLRKSRPAPTRLPTDLLEHHLLIESNRALRKGSFFALVLALVAVVTIPAVMAAGAGRGLELPWAFTGFCLVACAVLHRLAKRQAMTGRTAWVVMLAFVSLPTVFFVLAQLLVPAGAATFLNGPLAWLYAVLIAVTGCTFNPRLSATAGVVAAGGYLASAFVSLDQLALLAHPDATLAQDLTLPVLYVFRAQMLVFAGLVVAALAVIAKRLSIEVLREAREKDSIGRLFGEYVSEEVKDKLLYEPSADAGELRHVVILFSDVRHFTTYSESVTPEQLVKRLNEYFDEMVAAITAHGGVIDKFVGDAVMAVFGGVLDLDNPCESALRAAKEMRERLAVLNMRWTAAGEEPFDAGIGIHVGQVVQGAIGSRTRKDFTVIGDAVNTASRVEGLTKTYEHPILITAQVHDRLPKELRDHCAPLGIASVKGRGASIEVYGA